MATQWISPTWRMPEESNQSKFENYSLDFDGNNQLIQVDNDLFGGLEKFSVSFWYNMSTVSGDRAVIGRWSLADSQILIYHQGTTGYWRILFVNNSGTSQSLTTTFAATLNTWQFISFIYDGSNISVQLNNETVQSQASSGSIKVQTATPSFQIGADNSTRDFTGQLDQVCIFDYALSTDQRNYLYNLNNPMAIDGAEPVAYWPLGDNSNPIAVAGYPNISVGADSVFDFTSSLQYIDLNNSLTDFDVTDTFSISTWAKVDTITNYATITGATSGGAWSDGFGLFMHDVGGIKWGFWVDWWSATRADSIDNVVAGEWYHIVCTYSDLNGGKMYINNGTPTTFTGATLDGQGENICIGTISGAASYDFPGEITNTQFWNTEISVSEVETLYNNGQPLMTGTQPEEANLRAWYKLNQSANWEADNAGNWQIPDAVSAYPQSFDFPSISSGEYIDTNNNLDSFTSFTVSAWFNADNTTGNPVSVVSTRTGSIAVSKGFDIYIAANNLYWRIYDNGATQIFQSFASSKKHIWQNAVLTYDGSTLRAYLNGSLINSAVGSYVSSDANMLIGKWNAGSNYFHGQISNVQLWDSALPATGTDSVETLYNNGSPLTTAIASSNLKAWYKLDNSDKFNTVSNDWNVFNNITTEPSPNYITALSKTGYGANYSTCKSTTLPFSTDDVITSSFWMKTSYTGGNFGISSGVIGVGPFCYISGQLGLFRGPHNYRYFGGDTGFVNDGNWHHILLYSPGYAQLDINSVRIFIDGIEYSIGGTGYTATTPTYEVNYFGGYIGSSGYVNGTGTLISSNATIWNSDQTSNISEIYNNGTPPTSYSNNPDVWWTLIDTVTTTDGGWYDSSGNGNNSGPVTYTPTVVDSDVVAREYGISSGMTEQNLVNNNVSTLNGESSGMDTTNLVQSNISKQIPFSSYSVEFDGLNHFGLAPFSEFELQTISYSIWFKRTGGLTSNVCLISQGGSSNKGWTCWLDNTTIRGQFGANNNNSYTNSTVASYKNYIPDNTWGNITATCDGTDQKIYVNGILRNTYTDVATIYYTSVVGFRIGERVSGAANFYGEISNPAVWDQVLTADDVLNIYNNGVPQDLSNFRIAPLAWWELGGKYTYWNGTDLIARSTSSGDFDVTGANTTQGQIVGTAPGSTANGTGTNLDLSDLIGDMKDSKLNAYSINMADYADGVVNPANSGRSTEVP